MGNDYIVVTVQEKDEAVKRGMNRLLEKEGIRFDSRVDYSCVVIDKAQNVIAAGSCLRNTLRCIAVDKSRRSCGFLNQIVAHLTEVQAKRGYTHLFVHTKMENAGFFKDLGYSLIAHTSGGVAFLENHRRGFDRYLELICDETPEKYRSTPSCAIVMNANPFTLGHRYLTEEAAKRWRVVHLFVVSEDLSEFPFSTRYELVRRGTAHLANVVMHETKWYMISSATFPSYFLRDEVEAAAEQGALDCEVFSLMAKRLGVCARVLGTEPASAVTAVYNEVMKELLPTRGIECVIMPRKQAGGRVISAGAVRQAIRRDDWTELTQMLPETTLDFLRSDEAGCIVREIKAKDDVTR